MLHIYVSIVPFKKKIKRGDRINKHLWYWYTKVLNRKMTIYKHNLKLPFRINLHLSMIPQQLSRVLQINSINMFLLMHITFNARH